MRNRMRVSLLLCFLTLHTLIEGERVNHEIEHEIQHDEESNQYELLQKKYIVLDQQVTQLKQDLDNERSRNEQLEKKILEISSTTSLDDAFNMLQIALKNVTTEQYSSATKEQLESIQSIIHSSHLDVNSTLDAIYAAETSRLYKIFGSAFFTLVASVVGLLVVTHFHAEKMFTLVKVDTPESFSYAVPKSEKPGHGQIHRSPLTKDGPVGALKHNNVRTLHEFFINGCKLSKNSPCLGKRSIVNGRAGPYEYQSYNEISERITNFGSGVVHLNLLPLHDNMQLLGIYSKNMVEWIIAEYSCYAYSATVVPLYDSLGPDSVKYIVNQANLACIVVGGEAEAKTLLQVKSLCPSLTSIISIETPSEELQQLAKNAKVTLYHFHEIEKIGAANPKAHKPAKPEDIATFCYTSGTTGDPKGALLSHSNFVSNIGTIDMLGVHITSSDRYLSYLPLAHVLERVLVSVMLHCGAQIGFYQGDTRKILDDIAAVRPTIFASVPRLFSRIHDKVLEKVNTKGGLSSKLFYFALESKKALMKKGYATHPIWDQLLFNKIASKAGLGECRYMVSGSAPLAPYVMEFMRAVFPSRIVEGYGQTETCAVTTIGHPEDLSIGHVGGPTVSNEIVLFDVPEMNYLSTDTSHGDDNVPCAGRGEVCIRGHNIFKGYYKMSEKTSEAIDADGWNHTGDIGIWLPSGQLKIVDRKKNIFKLSQGEYVAAEKIENVYLASLFLEQIFVYGDSFQSFLVGILVPEKEYLMQWAKQQNISGTYEELCSNKVVAKAIMDDLERLAVGAKLNGFEKIRKSYVSAESFSDANGLLTPTFKVKRNEAKAYFQKEIDQMYA